MSIRILPVFNINARIYFISFSFEILNIFFNIFQIGKYIYIYIYMCVCVCVYIYIYIGHLVKKFAEFYGIKIFTDAFRRP